MSSDYYGSLAGNSALSSTNAASSTNNNSNSNNNNNNACTSTRWLTEEVFALIDLVQRNEAIYNPRHKYYFCRPYVENFWREVDLKLEKNPGASLAKWTNLRISFRREYTNYLEEKVPPCWTYFDRMFFLHPYLRKKHQQPKSLDSQVQDALVQISSLSSRLQRERAVAAAAASSLNQPSNAPSPSQPQLDNYLEYFDDPEPNHSEIDDIMDDEAPSAQHYAHSTLANDIKSECEDNVDDFDNPERPGDDEEQDTDDMRNFVFNSLEKRQQQQQQHQQRLQHLQRLQSRAFYEEFRNKRARSNENISSSQSFAGASAHLNPSSANHSSSSSSNNISFVRPTFAKPLEVVSTTTLNHVNASASNGNSQNSLAIGTNSSAINDEAVSNSTSRSSSSHHHASPHLAHAFHHSRYEISGANAQAALGAGASSTSATQQQTSLQQQQHTNAPGTPAIITTGLGNAQELCDCKTDPDAMFLMSLLPDIQKLNGRDRGKIKIAFQNILQDYLYPD